MNLFDVGVGVAIGLGLAACGWTFAKIGSWLSAKAKLLEAQVLHTNAVTAAVASSPVVAAAAAAATSAIAAAPASSVTKS